MTRNHFISPSTLEEMLPVWVQTQKGTEGSELHPEPLRGSPRALEQPQIPNGLSPLPAHGSQTLSQAAQGGFLPHRGHNPRFKHLWCRSRQAQHPYASLTHFPHWALMPGLHMRNSTITLKSLTSYCFKRKITSNKWFLSTELISCSASKPRPPSKAHLEVLLSLILTRPSLLG